MNFYSPFQHQRHGVMPQADLNAQGSTMRSIKTKLDSCDLIVDRIFEVDAERLAMAEAGCFEGESEGLGMSRRYSEGIRAEAGMRFQEALTERTIREAATVSEEMCHFTLTRLVGWQRKHTVTVLERTKGLCQAIRRTAIGSNSEAATVEQRHAVACVFNTLGHSGGTTEVFLLPAPAACFQQGTPLGRAPASASASAAPTRTRGTCQ